MRVRFFFGSLGLVALLAPVVLMACSAGGAGSAAPEEAEAGPKTLEAPPDSGKPADAGARDGDGATRKKNDCKLPEIKDVADVSPTFVIYASPTAMPPTMTGGTLSGSYTVDKVTVFLPSASAGLVDLKKSTGTVNAWAVFNGADYRLRLKADFIISSVAGPQAQGADTASQGAFTVSGAALTLDHDCDTAIAQEADYSFTDSGGGRATILIKTPSPYGDTYMQLDAAKN